MTPLNPPRLIVVGTGGDSGKTLVSLGLARHWSRSGIAVQAFKKGPDYIDSAWLTLASGRPTRNLDTWMMSKRGVIGSFTAHCVGDGLNLVESNRGLFDGENVRGTHSSAALAELLGLPVLLVLPVSKTTRTAAAVVLGMKTLGAKLNWIGVVLNFVGTERHREVTTRAVEEVTGLRVLGAIPRLKADPLPGRHLGLMTPEEHRNAGQAIDLAAKVMADCLDVERIPKAAQKSRSLDLHQKPPGAGSQSGRGLKIAYFSGSAFTFYYPDNLEALENRGACLVPVNPMVASALPDCDALYIGGGFPETHAARLADNRPFRESVAHAAERGLPIWAECGGLMFLARNLLWDQKAYPMAGVLPVNVKVHERPQGHGYEEVTVDATNPFLPIGTKLRGHEFHYSQIYGTLPLTTAFRVSRGTGIGDGRDGLVYCNVLASYLHLHAIGAPRWGAGLIAAARIYRNSRLKETAETSSATLIED